ncbi:MAG: response regulator [Acidobacteria bacterium]|nr:response regulator [Acidobacteriota bacterium]
MKSRTILVVDDDPAVLQAYGRLLGRNGDEVELCGDIEAIVLDPASLARADLLILDQRMPRITGLDLLARMRRILPAGSPGPRVLLIRAYLDATIRRQAARLGVAEIIEKPVNAAHLLKCVRAALDAGVAGSAA